MVSGRSVITTSQSAPAVYHDTTRLCEAVVTLWDCHIHADAVRVLSWIFSIYFLLSDGGSPRLVKKTEVVLAIKPLLPTSRGITFVIQPFLSHCSRRSSYFSNLRWNFLQKGTINSITKKNNIHTLLLWLCQKAWRLVEIIYIYIYMCVCVCVCVMTYFWGSLG